MRSARGLGLALVALAACKSPPPSDAVETAASPQAAAEPAPLANIPAQAVASPPAAGLTLDGSSPPAALRGDRALEPDPPAHDTVVYTLLAVLRPSDTAPLPKGPEFNQAGVEAARKKTDPLLSIDFTPTRARIVLSTAGFSLPAGTELRARSDRYGHVVLDPDGLVYRVAAPGVLRALLGERRLDVAPSSTAEIEDVGDGAKRVGRPTRRVAVTTRAAKAVFEITHLSDAGEGGALVCRALLDLINAAPSTPVCGDGDVPLHVELHWIPPPVSNSPRPSRTGFTTFDAYALARRTDVPPASFETPPSAARFDEGIPAQASGVVLKPAELASLRVQGDSEGEMPLTLVNSTDELRSVWIDGLLVAWLAPGARETLRGLPRGRYALQWRTFLADVIDPPQSVALPATSDVDVVPEAGGP